MSQIVIELSPELLEDLRERAGKRGIGVTELIRQGVALDRFVHDNLDRHVTISQHEGDDLPRLVVGSAGSPPPTPAPTREGLIETVDATIWRLAEHDDLGRQSVADMAATITDAVMALLSAEPAPPLWTGETVAPAPSIRSYLPDTVPSLPVPPGTAVEVRARV